MKTTTTILTIALLTSLAGNVVQYTTDDKPATELQVGAAETDEPTQPSTPTTEPSQQVLSWYTTATFAVTYQVEAKAGTPGGSTVKVYYIDNEPTVLKQKEKPTAKDVTWAPLPEGLPGVISIEVVEVKARGKKAED